MTHIIHHIQPIILDLPGPLAVRWYGLSYLMAFICGILLLRRWSKKNEFEVPAEEVSNFVVILGFFGVFLGGRVGYALFYDPELFIDFSPVQILGMQVPLWSMFKVWDGGMASHGGFIGVTLFAIWYARKHHHSIWNLTDNLACTASLGIGFGRLANFVNGELWGRVSESKWAMYFPQELGYSHENYNMAHIRACIADGTLQPRHPSQLYQAACEGFLVFGLMLLLRRTAVGKRPGALSACYLVLYALARIAIECFREPDNGQFFIGAVSKGQFYSLLMFAGAAVILFTSKALKPPQPDLAQ